MNPTTTSSGARPLFAVVLPNILAGLGLKSVLGDLFPEADVAVFHDFGAYEASQHDRYAHCFTSTEEFVLHREAFRGRERRTILLGRTPVPGMHAIDPYAGEERLVHALMRLHCGAHPACRGTAEPASPAPALSARETEVLAHIARGLANKQIAERLGIGVTTVVSHRRNLMEKLGIKSVAGLTLHALRLGCIAPDEL